MREIFVISDLHLGGEQPARRQSEDADSEDRGFRICTHGHDLARFVAAIARRPNHVELVINGDVVDFLAEQDENGGWSAFTGDEPQAIRKLDAIVSRDTAFFDALHELVDRGHRLTLLLGNHDIELALPAVRRHLTERLSIDGRHDYCCMFDGEAYAVGRVLVEHGNRYDSFNVVDHDSLRRVRSLLSRQQPIPPENRFEPPAGSSMVVDVINPIKAEYRMIDLLKPETGAAIPVLLALEPGYRAALARVARLAFRARRHRMAAPALPSFAADISAGTSAALVATDVADPDPSRGAAYSDEEALGAVLRETMHGTEDQLLSAIGSEPLVAADVSAFGALDGFVTRVPSRIDRTVGLAKLLSSNGAESRLRGLLAAVRSLQHDKSFTRDVEPAGEYFDAARELTRGGFDYVLFGHTHLARDVAMDRGSRYLNSGTWADMIRFPTEVLNGPPEIALDGLRAFVADLRAGRLRSWISFVPTYIHMRLDEDGVVRDVTLKDYSSGVEI
jgi:UDP-2,3-diacylglucosamine pyrophosphatase LpxH